MLSEDEMRRIAAEEAHRTGSSRRGDGAVGRLESFVSNVPTGFVILVLRIAGLGAALIGVVVGLLGMMFAGAPGIAVLISGLVTGALLYGFAEIISLLLQIRDRLGQG